MTGCRGGKRQMAKTRAAIKRALDVIMAAGGLLVLMPVFVSLALIILWREGSPVLFSQTRVGLRGRRFRIWKFRTMRPANGAAITAAGDTRITRIGSRLRKYKLDELPQLFNVLQGDMSLVGPRPEIPEYVESRAPIWRDVLQVRPGITDLASLVYRDEEELLGASADPARLYRERILPLKLQLNLSYLRSRSLARDLTLIWLTIRYSVWRKGFDPDLIQKTFGSGAGHDTRFHSFSSAINR
ncbi:MAG TPA: sugar transferase [Bryobacteraceae bacterium]|jgi:lipopolysaccharide/colanic/teichoic acid biosynthesis glycosyltransferase